MPLKITRRPYTDCSYSWSLSVSDINTAEGVVSESQCTDLNGDFVLDFSPCASKGRELVWVAECVGGESSSCGDCKVDFTVHRPEVTIYCPLDGSRTFPSYDYVMSYSGSCSWVAEATHGTGLTTVVRINRGTIAEPFQLSIIFTAPGTCGGTTGAISTAAHYSARAGASCEVPGFFDFMWAAEYPASGWCCYSTGHVPATLSVTSATSDFAETGPEKGDRIRSKWHLSYNIADELWTLRSFERIDYPIYTLADADPCDGETKTLVAIAKGSAADGCGVFPAEVTITRTCPPDREANSGLLEDRRFNGATGKKKRQCHACDCQDEVDDKRYSCGTKCTDTTTEGCESYTDEEAPCLYPKTTVCCDYCDSMDQPCSYIAEFECDISNPDAVMSGYTVLAARQVVLRQECPFDETCEWVAVGPSSNPDDGGVGAQPVCATCDGGCPETGCTWQSWSVGDCPDFSTGGCTTSDCASYNGCWSVDITDLAITGLTTVVISKIGTSTTWIGSDVDGDGNTVTVAISVGAGRTSFGHSCNTMTVTSTPSGSSTPLTIASLYGDSSTAMACPSSMLYVDSGSDLTGATSSVYVTATKVSCP